MASRWVIGVEPGDGFDPDDVATLLKRQRVAFANYVPGFWLVHDVHEQGAGHWRDLFIRNGARRVIVIEASSEGDWAASAPRDFADWMKSSWE